MILIRNIIIKNKINENKINENKINENKINRNNINENKTNKNKTNKHKIIRLWATHVSSTILFFDSQPLHLECNIDYQLSFQQYDVVSNSILAHDS